MAFRERHYRWTLQLNAAPEDLWPFVADTNRFNRDAGVPQVEMGRLDRRLRNARRRVRLSIYGMPVEWEEQPFEWVRPVRFGVERIYSKGPMARMRVLAQLTPRPEGGTTITYDIWATPRNYLGVAAIPFQLRSSTGPSLRAAFKRYDEMASKGVDADVGRVAPTVVDLDQSRLEHLRTRLLASLENVDDKQREAVERLEDHVRQGDDFAVARIRPFQLADDWDLPRRLVLEICLRATRIGLLDLQWDLLCPLCRGAPVSAGSLGEIESNVHCGACQIDFKVDFDRYVELTFRPNAAIRQVSVGEYCIGSPQKSPHVVAQQLLAPREQRILTASLGPGSYRARILELSGARSLTVAKSGAQSATLAFSEHQEHPVDEVVVSESPALQLENNTDLEQLFILERTEWNDQAATAAEVTSLQTFRDLFSSEALRPGEQISVGTLTILFTDLKQSTQLYREIGDATAFGRVMSHFDVLKQAIAKYEGALVKTIGDAVMAVFQRPKGALLAMLEAQDQLSKPGAGSMPLLLKAGIHRGPCIAVTLNGRLDYFGSTVNLAARLEGLSCGSDVIISGAVYEDAEVQELFANERCEASGFRVPLKGFAEEEFALWRVARRAQLMDATKEASTRAANGATSTN